MEVVKYILKMMIMINKKLLKGNVAMETVL